MLPGTSAKFIDSINKMGFRPNSLSDYPVKLQQQMRQPTDAALLIVCSHSGFKQHAGVPMHSDNASGDAGAADDPINWVCVVA